MSSASVYAEMAAENIGRVVINRPEQLNALSLQILEEIWRNLEIYSRDEKVRAIILTGAGGKAFVAGADIEEMSKMNPLQFRNYGYHLNRIGKIISSCEKPVIGAVKGFCFGGGYVVAYGCALVFATEKSSFGQQEITLGIMGGLPKLAALSGARKAFDLVLTGRIIKAKEAEAWGLINQALPEEGFDEFVLDYARKLAAKPAFAMKLLKASKVMCEKAPLETAMVYEEELMALCFASEDSKEGLKAFVEKRKPQYRGN
jgi:enoyl-CoA hydratase/carnithine racemase